MFWAEFRKKKKDADIIYFVGLWNGDKMETRMQNIDKICDLCILLNDPLSI